MRCVPFGSANCANRKRSFAARDCFDSAGRADEVLQLCRHAPRLVQQQLLVLAALPRPHRAEALRAAVPTHVALLEDIDRMRLLQIVKASHVLRSERSKGAALRTRRLLRHDAVYRRQHSGSAPRGDSASPRRGSASILSAHEALKHCEVTSERLGTCPARHSVQKRREHPWNSTRGLHSRTLCRSAPSVAALFGRHARSAHGATLPPATSRCRSFVCVVLIKVGPRDLVSSALANAKGTVLAENLDPGLVHVRHHVPFFPRRATLLFTIGSLRSSPFG